MDGEIDPAAVEELLASDAAVRVVDVRSREAFAEGHIPGSECLPLGTFPEGIERLDGAERVVTVCPHGEASVRAARLLAAYGGLAGARIESMAGGLAAWEGELVSGDADVGATESDAPF